MGKHKKISIEKRNTIITLHNESYSYRQIVNKMKVSLKFSCTFTTTFKLLAGSVHQEFFFYDYYDDYLMTNKLL